MNQHIQLSPQNRRGKHRGSAPTSPTATVGPPTHGLVSYLQQMHGLTKKRSYGSKATKRASSGDTPRQAASSRPILPRLDLPDSRLRGWSPYPTTSPPNRAIMEKAVATAPRYPPTAPPPLEGASGADEGRRSRSRWPWLCVLNVRHLQFCCRRQPYAQSIPSTTFIPSRRSGAERRRNLHLLGRLHPPALYYSFTIGEIVGD